MFPPESANTSSAPASSHSDLARRPAALSRQELSIGGFDEHNENLHGVEFEAPFSSESQKPPLTKGRFSIDFSIELERQLEGMEASPPGSPPATVDANADENIRVGADPSITEADVTLNGQSDKELLDPEILAHIITQLRQSLLEITKERDELVKMLGHANEEEATVKDALQLMTEKATQAEEELGEAKIKMKEDEEQIVLLRAKVEESRRGLMRLQTESRRQSMAPIDISRASSLTLPNFGNPPSSKRASFTPLTGSRHGRTPSISDNNLVIPVHNSPPKTHGDAGLSPNGPSGSRRVSGLFGRVSPGIPDSETDGSQSPNHAEVETLKTQIKCLKNELESVKHELTEANEAKEASDTCAKALREFIAENHSIGAMPVKLPPLPTMVSEGQDSTAAAEPKKTGSGWGFKIWGSGSGGSSTSSGIQDPHGVTAPPPMTAAPSGVLPTPVTGVPLSTAPAPTPAPLSRKLTGFFSSRSSVSSKGSSAQAKGSSGAGAVIDRTNSTCSYSDVSSVAEPMSPILVNDDLNVGLGLREMKLVKQVASLTDMMSLDLAAAGGGGGGGGGQETPPISLHEVDLDNGLR